MHKPISHNKWHLQLLLYKIMLPHRHLQLPIIKCFHYYLRMLNLRKHFLLLFNHLLDILFSIKLQWLMDFFHYPSKLYSFMEAQARKRNLFLIQKLYGDTKSCISYCIFSTLAHKFNEFLYLKMVRVVNILYWFRVLNQQLILIHQLHLQRIRPTKWYFKQNKNFHFSNYK
jgi:hypothetical protein